MGFITALMVFVFPVGLPIVTLIAVVKVSCTSRPLSFRLLRGAFLVAVLTLLLGPSIQSTVAGSFALPWWLLVGTGGVENYLWQYALIAFCSIAALSALVSVYRAVRSR